MGEMTQREMNDVYRMIRDNQDLMPVINTDPQPSAAAKRLVDVLWDADVLRSTRTTIEASTVIESAAIALDDAGVGKAVAILEVLKQETWMASWLAGKVTSALAVLTGNDDAT